LLKDCLGVRLLLRRVVVDSVAVLSSAVVADLILERGVDACKEHLHQLFELDRM
jgi:hypothetical protein